MLFRCGDFLDMEIGMEPLVIAPKLVKSLNAFVIEPMTLERLRAIKKLSNYKFRILEDQRLTTLSDETIDS